MNIEPQVKKFIKHKFPFFVDFYRDLKVKVEFDQKYWNRKIYKTLELVKDLEINPYDKIKPKKYSERPFSKHAIVEINNTCNLNCAMCQTMSATRKRGKMDLGLLTPILSKLSQKGVETIALHTLGDPLANPRLPAVLEEIRSFNMKTSICTNGLLLEKHVNTLIEYIDVVPSISFSIDGAKAETYEKIRIGGKFSKLIEQLEISNDKLRKKGMTVKIHFTLSKDNMREVGDFISTFRKYVPRPSSDLSFGVITGLAPDNRYFNSVNPFPNLSHKNVMCWRPKGDPLWVNVDGTVSACCRDYHGDLIVGDITKQSYDEIVHGKDLLNLQKAHEKNDLKKYEPCDNCYRPDKRLDQIMNNLIQYLIFKRKDAQSSYYQTYVNKIIEIFQGNGNYKFKLKNLLEPQIL